MGKVADLAQPLLHPSKLTKQNKTGCLVKFDFHIYMKLLTCGIYIYLPKFPSIVEKEEVQE